ncbi:helix-turn-helix transcriptional regulator [Pseudomonas sp. BN417]|uniref:helix-turn-helix domain-containing protein n=1 Tax=Pseudomonas sp. BN417 TaxID=2567890 RepID=UPI002455C5F3|nr:helix-turn-helix transcriptional regulator [Pseudomonas sp. BN417]MDH4558366.1 helix-turn-helix transcriptional regulator [Pseudomonas sp. BN417]
MTRKLLIPVGVGTRLREERERLGKNQTEFGALVGVSRGTQKAYELEHSSPDVSYLSKLQDLEVDVQYVVTGARNDVARGSLTELETTLLQAFRVLSTSDQETLARIAVALSGTPPSAA